MRKIEQEMVAAVRARRPWRSGNTEVVIYGDDGLAVSLHGHIIYKEVEGRFERSKFFNLQGWNTVTTRSRLRALGIAVSTKQGRAMLGADYITEDNWYAF